MYPARVISSPGQHPLRILQAGMGIHGRDWASRVLPAVAGVELAGCVDPDATARKLTRRMVGLPPRRLFERLDQGLAAVQSDAVLVTAVLPGHVPVATSALEAGKHVLVEKPFAPSVFEAQKLVQLAAERGLTLMVSQNYRFFPAVLAVAQMVRSGELGALHHVSIDFRRYSSFAQGPGAHFAYEQPLLVDMSIHHFDLLRMIVGREPVRVTCETWNPPWSRFDGPPVGVATIDFDNGPVVSYRGSWISAGQPTPWGGEWRMDFENAEVMWTARGDAGSLADVVIVRPRGGKPKTRSLRRLGVIDRWATLTEFASAIRERREPQCSGRDNLGSLALVAAAVESADKGAPVSIPPTLD
jgi:predicted dehydrogenase